MKTKVAALALAFALAGVASAESHTVAVDIAPMIGGIALESFFSLASEGGGTGFGAAVQYERRLLPLLGVGGRFAYLGAGMTLADAKLSLWSISVEGHGRVYPFAGRFFLDGLFGYAVFVMDLEKKGSPGMYANEHFFKAGGKFGWKFVFGAPVGFTFEMAYGYSGIFGGRGSFVAFGQEFGGEVEEWKDWLPSLFFVGGLKAALCFGVSF